MPLVYERAGCSACFRGRASAGRKTCREFGSSPRVGSRMNQSLRCHGAPLRPSGSTTARAACQERRAPRQVLTTRTRVVAFCCTWRMRYGSSKRSSCCMTWRSWLLRRRAATVAAPPFFRHRLGAGLGYTCSAVSSISAGFAAGTCTAGTPGSRFIGGFGVHRQSVADFQGPTRLGAPGRAPSPTTPLTGRQRASPLPAL